MAEISPIPSSLTKHTRHLRSNITLMSIYPWKENNTLKCNNPVLEYNTRYKREYKLEDYNTRYSSNRSNTQIRPILVNRDNTVYSPKYREYNRDNTINTTLYP